MVRFGRTRLSFGVVRHVPSECLVGIGTVVTFRGAADRSRPSPMAAAGSTPVFDKDSQRDAGVLDSPGGTFLPQKTIPSLREDLPRTSSMSVPMRNSSLPSRGALVRDLLIFHLKLWLDGLKDIVLLPLSLVAAGVDFVFRTRLFYRVLRIGERYDLWLNLFGAARHAEQARDGLFGVSRAGDSTLLGQLEQLQGGESASGAKPVTPRA